MADSGGEAQLAANCAVCERGGYEPSPWMHHVWKLYSLQRGGYPFGQDDLTEEEWIDLGVLRDALEIMRAGVHGGR